MKKILSFLLLFTMPAFPQYTIPTVTGATAVAGCVSELPTAVGNLEGWWSADCYTNSSGCTTPAPGTITTNWYDQSGTSNTATVHGTCTFAASQINGKPAVSFDGSTCYFTLPNTYLTSNFTAFAVIVNASTAAKEQILGGSLEYWAYWTCNSSKEQGADLQNNMQVGTGTAACDTSWHQMNTVLVQNSTYAFRLGGASDGSGTWSTALSNIDSPTTIGIDPVSSDTFMNGKIAELFYFDAAVGSTDVQKLECYLKGKYGI